MKKDLRVLQRSEVLHNAIRVAQWEDRILQEDRNLNPQSGSTVPDCDGGVIFDGDMIFRLEGKRFLVL